MNDGTGGVGGAGGIGGVSGVGGPREEGGGDEFYERLKAYEGRVAATSGRGKDPVNAPMIRHWCEAMGDAHPAYTSPPDGEPMTAPPTMLQAWTMGGLSGHEVSEGSAGRSEAYDELLALLDGAGCTSVVATDCEQEYLRPLRPGDLITFDALIESVSPRKTTKLGTGHFVTTRMNVHANGEPAGTHRFRILKYAPARPKPTSKLTSNPAPEAAVEPEARREPKTRREAEARRPRPVVNRDNAGFWDGVADHKLLIQRCTGCETFRFPWLPGCNACGSADWKAVEASGVGTVYSYVVMRHPPFPAFDPPYAVGLIELAEGVRMVANVTGVPYDEVRIGMPVTLEFLRVDDELELPAFRGVDA
ncbi:bifunctional MaoC family dehydratase N-terminal/OB-fold nucleic acid binding domain-containing protein [Streptomyces sp. H27-D2]|uniref:bifunctional MaoC family dehydratase N-terminal/OB-fold nucleic acid binding domain-containing protein n=1 Tax=Streptomyces sp. H27-D2 TaxID=3046304 RepID=UPI002DB78FDC|nr:OB-fold domain-containing protein [Streptomyces sp. H27-D2]MEC4018888.1 OB-fold domain-containing protein [Streptomyces sp. H27-D2]